MIIRKVLKEDAKRYLEMLKKLDEETKFMMFEIGERKTTIEIQENIINNNTKNGNPMFLAEIDGEIVGFIGGLRGSCNRVRHSLYIAIGILKKYRGVGIGKALMEKVEEWGEENDVKRIELTVICENKKAVGLYEKMGFEIEGVKRNSMKIEGNFVDEYYMGKLFE